MLINPINNTSPRNYIQKNREDISPSYNSYGVFNDFIAGTEIDTQKLNTAYKAYSLTKLREDYKEIKAFKIKDIGEGRVYKSYNGHIFILLKKPGPTTVNTFIKGAGAYYDPYDKKGRMHYLEHIIAGSHETSALGALANAATSPVTTNFHSTFSITKPDELKKLIKTHCKMIQNPDFSSEVMNKRLKIILAEKDSQDKEGCIIQRAKNLLYNNLFNTDFYKGYTIGTEQTLDNITKQDLIDAYKSNYKPENMITVIVGDVDFNNTPKLLTQCFNRENDNNDSSSSNIYPVLDNPIQETKLVKIQSPDVTRSSIFFAFVGPQNGDLKEDFLKFALNNAVTQKASVHRKEILDTPENSGIISANLNDHQVIEFDIECDPQDEDLLIQHSYRVFSEIANKGITEKELKILKDEWKKSIAKINESSIELTYALGQCATGNGDISFYTDVPSLIDSLTTKDIQNFAKKYLDLNKASIVIVQPANKSSQKQEVSFKSHTENESENEKSIKKYELPNNLQLIVDNSLGITTTNTSLMLKALSVPKTQPGTAFILSEILNSHPKNYTRKQFYEILEENGIDFSISIEKNILSVNIDCEPEKLPLAINLLKSLIYNPDISPKKLEEVKSNIRNNKELLELFDEAESILYERLYGDSHYSIKVSKAFENVDNVIMEDIQSLYNSIVSNAQGQSILTIPDSKYKVSKDKIFNSFSREIPMLMPYESENNLDIEDAEPVKSDKVIVKTKDKEQTHIVQGFKVVEDGSIKNHVSNLLINEMMSGSNQAGIYQDLRERQLLTYNVNSNYYFRDLIGTFILKTDLKVKNSPFCAFTQESDSLKKALDSFKEGRYSLINNAVSVEKLDLAKSMLKNKLLLQLETSENKNDLIKEAYSTPYNSEYVDRLLSSIDEIAPNDIQEQAGKLFKDNHSVTAITTSKETYEKNKNYLNSLGQVEVLS